MNEYPRNGGSGTVAEALPIPACTLLKKLSRIAAFSTKPQTPIAGNRELCPVPGDGAAPIVGTKVENRQRSILTKELSARTTPGMAGWLGSGDGPRKAMSSTVISTDFWICMMGFGGIKFAATRLGRPCPLISMALAPLTITVSVML